MMRNFAKKCHATLNPFRYRKYVFDQETGLYCLGSRYYDPEVGRFVNADVNIADVTGYYEASMDMLDAKNRRELFPEARPKNRRNIYNGRTLRRSWR